MLVPHHKKQQRHNQPPRPLKKTNQQTLTFSFGLRSHFIGLHGLTVVFLQALFTLFQGFEVQLSLLQDWLLGGFLNAQ